MRILTWTLLATLMLSACGKDKSLEDHQKEKAEQEANRLSAVAGNYRGSITSQRTGESMGGFEIQLSLKKVPNDSSDNSSSKSRLAGSATVYSGGQQTSAVIELADFSSSNEDAANGTFSGRLTVPLRNASVQLLINGAIRGDSFTGTITPDSRPGTAANFNLVKGGALNGGQNSTNPNPSRTTIYSGSFKDPNCAPRRGGRSPCRNGEIVQVRLRLDRNPQTADEAFLNNFLDSQFVGLQASFDEATLSMPNAELNERGGTIRFQGIVQGSISTQASLNCSKLGAGWRCRYASGNFGISYDFDVLPGAQ